ncbi:MAG TPA: dCTP deaminase [Candidatus Nanoarchaeia archaeon]|nr:dCTP deaminase [Candidatus Nanoarchaeia archaeon]
MVVLSDREIKEYLKQGRIVIQGLDESYIDACSVDLRLGNKFRTFHHSNITHVDTRKGLDPSHMQLIEKNDDEPFIVHPGDLVLATTKEYLKMPDDLVGTLDGRSSLGRLGVVVHSTANSFDPGFEGFLTLEVSNISKIPVALWPGQRVCRITFTTLSSPAERPYNKKPDAKYSAQQDPASSRIFMDK